MSQPNSSVEDAQAEFIANLMIHGIEAGYNLQDDSFTVLVAQALAFDAKASRDMDEAETLVSKMEHKRAVQVLSAAIEYGERYFSQVPIKALAEEAYGYTLARLYATRAAARAGQASQAGGSKVYFQQALEDIDKALSYPSKYYDNLAPDFYGEMSQLREALTSTLRPTSTGSNNAKMIAEARKLETKVEEIKAELYREDQGGNQLLAVYAATKGIKAIEDFFSRFQEEVTREPKIKAIFGAYLVTFYAMRSRLRYMLAESGAPERQELLADAKVDVEQTLSFPASYFNNPDLKPQLRELQSSIREAQNKKSGCFIATAVYGSPWAPEIVMLRSFRENQLRPHRSGRWMIRVYERYSPPLADVIASRPTARLWVRRLLLTPVIYAIHRFFP